MKLKKLTINNIASIEKAEIDFAAAPLEGEHLFLITGDTGSGKSTIIDCLCLALYGNTPRLSAALGAEYENANNQEAIRTTDPRQLLRRGTAKAEIKLTFEDNNGVPYVATWEVHRSRNSVEGALQRVTRTLSTEDGVVPPVMLRNVTEINAFITDLIGLDMNQFFRTVVLAQGKFAEFLNSDEKEKADLLEKMTGIDIYAKIGAKIYQVCQEKEKDRNFLLDKVRSIILLTDDDKEQINRDMTTLNQEQTVLSGQIDGAGKMLRWLDDKAKNEKDLADKKDDLAEKQARAQEAVFLEQRQLVTDWDATVEPRRELKDNQDAQEQIKSLMGEKPAMQKEFDLLCAALRTTVKDVESQRKQLHEVEEYLRQEAPNSEMYKNIKSIKDQLKLRQDEQKNIVDYTRALQQEQERQPRVEEEMKKAGESQQQQEEQIRQIVAQYEAMNVAGIVAKKDSLSKAKEALSLLRASNIAVDEASGVLGGLNSEMSKEQHELEMAQATVDDKRALVKQAQEAVDREKDFKNLLVQAHKSLHEGDDCPVCGHKIDKLLDPQGDNVIEELRARHKQAEEELKKTETAIAASQKAINQLSVQATRSQEDLMKKTKARDQQRQVAGQQLELCGRHLENAADNAAVDALIIALDADADELSKTLKRAEDLNKRITDERDKLSTLADAHNKAKNELNLIKESIEHQQHLIATTTERIGSLTDNLNALFTMADWQERIAADADFIPGLARKAEDYQAMETKQQSLRESIGRAEAVIPAMQDNKDNIKGLDDNGLTCDMVPSNLDEQWRQFENRNIHWNHQLNNERDKAEKAQRALDKYLAENPAISMERILSLGGHLQSEIDGIRQIQKALMDSITHDQGEITALTKRQTELAGQKPEFAEEDRERLDDILSKGESQSKELIDKIAELKARLKEDENKSREVGEKKQDLEKAEAEYKKWADFNSVLGSSRGDTFKKIALSYILDELLHRANGYLSQFNNRYELEANPGSLVILVRDLLQGDVTSASTLSGGESFMVSLALALALSSMSGKVFTVDTIFIDEGFGSLSTEYLANVMETLNRLYDMGGRRVGIISHVDILKRHITTQIQVKRDKKNNTVSRIEVVEGAEY